MFSVVMEASVVVIASTETLLGIATAGLAYLMITRHSINSFYRVSHSEGNHGPTATDVVCADKDMVEQAVVSMTLARVTNVCNPARQ